MTEVDAYSNQDSSGEGGSSAWKIVLLLLVVAGAVAYGVYQMMPAGQAKATNVWFYDLGTGKLFPAMEEVPPIVAPGGAFEGQPGGVLAAVYSCGQCSEEGKRFVAWVATAKAEDRAKMEKTVIPANVASGAGIRLEFLQSTYPDSWQIRSPEKNAQWLASSSSEAAKLRQKALKHCGEFVTPIPCPGTDMAK